MLSFLSEGLDIQSSFSARQSTALSLVEPVIIYYLLTAYSPVSRTGSPQVFSQVQILHKLNTIQNMHVTCINVKHTNINLKVSPFGIALAKKQQIKLGDAGTIDRLGLAFSYKCIKANTSAMWKHILHITPTKVLIS